MTGRQHWLVETELPVFACNGEKRPLTRRGYLDAKVMQSIPHFYPLVGVPTGALSGFDVLDIDGDAGRRWYDQNFDALPLTRCHETRSRGLHLLFRHSPGLIPILIMTDRRPPSRVTRWT
jgi:hypothetical protein